MRAMMPASPLDLPGTDGDVTPQQQMRWLPA
jgi:hypothetical protein